ncbi:prepilin-type N-terminal cleavage/methylation domain-containing protein [Nautilia sp.]
MKKAFTLIEIIFVIVIIGLLSSFVLPRLLNLKAHSVIESISYTLTTGTDQALEAAANYIYLENNTSFKLRDILKINEQQLVPGLKWNYTTNGSYNKDGTYSLRDETYASPQVVLRITLDKDNRLIKFRINCKNLRVSTHGKLRELCIKKWGDEDIQEEISF